MKVQKKKSNRIAHKKTTKTCDKVTGTVGTLINKKDGLIYIQSFPDSRKNYLHSKLTKKEAWKILFYLAYVIESSNHEDVPQKILSATETMLLSSAKQINKIVKTELFFNSTQVGKLELGIIPILSSLIEHLQKCYKQYKDNPKMTRAELQELLNNSASNDISFELLGVLLANQCAKHNILTCLSKSELSDLSGYFSQTSRRHIKTVRGPKEAAIEKVCEIFTSAGQRRGLFNKLKALKRTEEMFAKIDVNILEDIRMELLIALLDLKGKQSVNNKIINSLHQP